MTTSTIVRAVAAAALAAATAVPATAGDNALDSLLADGTLSKTRNPVPANFLLAEGEKHLTADQRAAALGQLRDGLKSQINVMRLFAEQTTEGMNGEEAQKQMEWAKKNTGAGSVVKSMLGIGPRPPEVNQQKMMQEAKQATIDPWVRGIEAAHALVKTGDAQAAGNFYYNCLQFLQSDWVPSACVDAIVDMGPRRANLLLTWMLDNADTVSVASGGFAPPPPAPRHGKAEPAPAVVELRVAALEGLGALAAPGALEGDTRETAMNKVLSYATGKENAPYLKGAALGLGRSRDQRALEPLRQIAKDSRKDVRLAAWRGLAVAFHDDSALKALRSELSAGDLQEQLDAAQILFEVGDDAALNWAVETIGRRRTSDAKQADIRPQVVRSLVALGGDKARPTLERALATGTGNDWLEAWVRVALLELGDQSQFGAVQSTLAKEDWSLDPRGFRSIWRAIKPLLYAVAQTMMTGGVAAPSAVDQVKHAVQLIGNFAEGERGHYLANADARKAAIAQLRWQTADALAVTHPPGAAAVLEKLLDDEAPAVRLSAAKALASLGTPDALDGIVTAFGRDYGNDGGTSRTAEVRGALLRAAVIRFPQDARLKKLLTQGAADPDPGVRFIALAAMRPAA
ncbi:MAG TPA: HEAT repeat domain-containing protein [Thermoanaerobaculaceae bacterium]|nr:HEAT repeat domain-containing protein [Thermoanaerobaculaceae bacterium]